MVNAVEGADKPIPPVEPIAGVVIDTFCPNTVPLEDGEVIVVHAVVVIVGATGDVCFPKENPSKFELTVGAPVPRSRVNAVVVVAGVVALLEVEPSTAGDDTEATAAGVISLGLSLPIMLVDFASASTSVGDKQGFYLQ